MADPVKSDEIEDVLSSIRRLVTEHQPPMTAADPAGPAAADKLVLTPALRVTDPEDPWVPIAAQNDLSDEAGELPRGDGVNWAEELWGDENSGSDPDFDPQLQADIWEGAEAAGGTAPEIEQEPPAVGDATEPDESLFLPSDEADDADGDFVEAEDIVAPAQDLSDLSEEEQSLGADEEAPVSFIRSPRSVVEYEPEEGHIAVPDEEPPFATLELAEARAAQMAVSGVLSDVTANSDDEAAEAGEGAADAEVSEQAEPTAEPTPQADDAADASNYLAEETPGDGPDPISQTQNDAGDNATVEDLGESPFSFPDDDVSFVDEETLREIISDVVREELQGEMGKRITRNIRKLVRREIRIALATDELED